MESVKIETKIRISLLLEEIAILLQESNCIKKIELDGKKVDLVIQLFDYEKINKPCDEEDDDDDF